MAQFIGFVQGNKGQASRLGTKASGLQVEANGWTTGARIYIEHHDGKDHVRVYRTGGSGPNESTLVAEWEEESE